MERRDIGSLEWKDVQIDVHGWNWIFIRPKQFGARG